MLHSLLALLALAVVGAAAVALPKRMYVWPSESTESPKPNCTASASSPRITTSLGTLVGQELVSDAGNKGLVFLGMPFADPPVGDLRFRPSRLYDTPWTGERDATQYKDDCIMTQNNGYIEVAEQSEDCLYINVITSQHCLETKDCPVLMYIFGGAFNFGSPREYDPALMIDHFVSQDIIFAIPNYRMGALGTWHMDDADTSGNYITYDSVAALEWIQREIGAFGGSKDAVTVMGDSSGAMCVSLLTLAPRARGLFARAVTMSGSAVAPSMVAPTNASRAIAIDVGCAKDEADWDQRDPAEIIACMRHVPTSAINDAMDPAAIGGADVKMTDAGMYGLTFDELVAQRQPRDQLGGVTKKEITGYVKPAFELLDFEEKDIKLVVIGLCLISAPSFGLKPSIMLAQACAKFYEGQGLDSASQVGEIMSDSMFNLPTIVDGHNMTAVGGTSFLYSFDYVPKSENPDMFPGHAADLDFVLWNHRESYDATDLAVEKTYTDMFANFIKRGSIDIPALKDSKSFNYLSISESSGPKDGLHKDAYDFWYSVAPALAGMDWGLGKEMLEFVAPTAQLMDKVDELRTKPGAHLVYPVFAAQRQTLKSALGAMESDSASAFMNPVTIALAAALTVVGVALLASVVLAARYKFSYDKYQRISE